MSAVSSKKIKPSQAPINITVQETKVLNKFFPKNQDISKINQNIPLDKRDIRLVEGTHHLHQLSEAVMD
jgi:hypothetical protein